MCPYCDSLKIFLKEHDIEFEELNIEDEKIAQELVTKTNQIGIPVIEIDDKIVIGFDKQKICQLLKIKE